MITHTIADADQYIAYLDEEGNPQKAPLDTYVLQELQFDLRTGQAYIYGTVLLTYRLNGKPVMSPNQRRLYSLHLNSLPEQSAPLEILVNAVATNTLQEAL